MKGRDVFIVGGGGFLGRNAIRELLGSGVGVVALQRRSAIPPAPGLRIATGALEDAVPVLAEAMRGCGTLVHLAGASTPASSAADPAGDVLGNVLPTLNLLKAAANAGIERVVFASSGGTVYGRPQRIPIAEDHPVDPSCSYGAVKLATEHLLRLWADGAAAAYIVLRIANPYGPHQRPGTGQGVIGAWLPRALAGAPLEVWGDGRVVRDYLYVGDVARAIVRACSPGVPSGTYNLGSGRGADLLQIAAAIGRVLGGDPELRFKPGRPIDISVNVLDSGKFMAASGWCPSVDLDQGIRHAADALRAGTPALDPTC